MNKKNQENKPEQDNNENKEMDPVNDKDIVIEETESKVHKIIRIGLTALAAVATGVLGFIIGRNVHEDDKDESDDSEKEDTAA